jgi:hypothetical protein
VYTYGRIHIHIYIYVYIHIHIYIYIYSITILLYPMTSSPVAPIQDNSQSHEMFRGKNHPNKTDLFNRTEDRTQMRELDLNEVGC